MYQIDKKLELIAPTKFYIPSVSKNVENGMDPCFLKVGYLFHVRVD